MGKMMVDSVFHLDDFRLPSAPPATEHQRQKLQPRKKQEPFLKGPVPMPWLRAAARLPGKALCVGVELWFQVGLLKSREVAVNLSRFKLNGIGRAAASRGLAALHAAKLVSVIRHPGRKPLVRLEVGTAASMPVVASPEI